MVTTGKLVFTTQPASGAAGSALPTQPVVTIQDTNSATVTGATSQIALSITPRDRDRDRGSGSELHGRPVGHPRRRRHVRGLQDRQAGDRLQAHRDRHHRFSHGDEHRVRCDAAVTPLPTRIFGPDAIDTSIAVSQAEFGSGAAAAVVLARSEFFSDALAGGPLAAADHVRPPEREP
jgi:hypothetical protein